MLTVCCEPEAGLRLKRWTLPLDDLNRAATADIVQERSAESSGGQWW